MRSSAGRLSQSTIAGLIGAAAFAVLTAGTAVAVSTTAVSITNPETGNRVHVTKQSTLVTSDRDPYNGVYGRIDAAGRQVTADAAPAAAAVLAQRQTQSFLSGNNVTNAYFGLPATGRIRITAVSFYIEVPVGQHVDARLFYTAANGEGVTMVPTLAWQNVMNGVDKVVGTLVADVHPAPGSTIGWWVDRSSGNGTGSVTVSYVGELS
jgi:hypothetical protein